MEEKNRHEMRIQIDELMTRVDDTGSMTRVDDTGRLFKYARAHVSCIHESDALEGCKSDISPSSGVWGSYYQTSIGNVNINEKSRSDP